RAPLGPGAADRNMLRRRKGPHLAALSTDLSQMDRSWGLDFNSRGEFTQPKEQLQRFSRQRRRQYPLRRGLIPAHKTLLLRSSPEIRPPGAPRTPGDSFRARLSGRPTSTRGTGRAQPGDPLQNPGEQLPRDGDFRQLEGEVLGVGYHLGPDLDQFLPQ